jgi:hypothetical protein
MNGLFIHALRHLCLTVGAAFEDNPLWVGRDTSDTFMRGKKAKQLRAADKGTMASPKRHFPRLVVVLLPFVFGAALTAAGFLMYSQSVEPKTTFNHRSYNAPEAGHRTVAQLMALSNSDLENVDVLEMNIAVAREIPGLEKLDYDHYRQIVDGWTDQFRRWLPTVEHAFYQKPDKYKNDINFYRLGMLAQFLDEQIGVAYVEDQKQTQLDARKAGKKAEVSYTNPGHLLLHGLIDTKRGTCATMATLHVTIGRLLGWPVGLACVNAHYVCRYDDGKVYYNIEATDTGRGGFSEGSDKDYMDKESVPPKAVACGSDLRKLSGREMLGIFIAARGRHFTDTGKLDLAARDYALAYPLAPNNRKIYIGLVGNLIESGEKLFAADEFGHPASLAVYLAGKYQTPTFDAALAGRPGYPDPIVELNRINAINRANRDRMTQPPPMPGVSQPNTPYAPRPGVPQPYQAPGFPQQPQPPR